MLRQKCAMEIIDKLGHTNDIKNTGYGILNGSNDFKLGINNKLAEKYTIATNLSKKNVLVKRKDKNQFKLIVGPYESKPHKKGPEFIRSLE